MTKVSSDRSSDSSSDKSSDSSSDKSSDSRSRTSNKNTSAERAFSSSILISGIRCGLTYVLIPFVFPLLGFSSGAGPLIGIPVGLVAIAANLVSIRRFSRSDHRWRRLVMAINSAIIVLLVILVAVDLTRL